MNKIEIKKSFFKKLGIKSKYFLEEINCDICGNNKKKDFLKKITLSKDKLIEFPYSMCLGCGHLFQKYKFEKQFYKNFYLKYYRNITHNSTKIEPSFFQDQINRGKILYNSLNGILPSSGTMLDVGCSSGGTMVPFIKKNWKCYGNDPDKNYVEYGKSKKLNIDYLSSENMTFKKKFFDLILILGSLEHCYDINKVMSKCSKYSKDKSIIVLEGRGRPKSEAKKFFNFNHHRIFTHNSFELLLLKHGWMPLFSTFKNLSGPTRPNTIFTVGIKNDLLNKKYFQNIIRNGKKDDYTTLKETYLKLNKG
jgi:ubiquinone/menaquinone biosynthesis C-methylase UbiE